MGQLARILRSHPQSDVANPQSWFVDWLGGGTSSTGIQVNEVSALSSTAVYACHKILAESIASLPIHVYREGEGRRDKAPDHPLYPILHLRPNPEMTAQEFFETLTGHLMGWGNCFAEIQRDNGGRPLALWPLRPDRMQIYRDPETFELDYQFTLYRGGVAHLKPGEVLHVRLLSRDGIYGLSPIGQNMETIGLDLALRRYGGKLFGNSGVPIGAIQYPKRLTREQKGELREDFNKQHTGLDNAARTALFEEGMSWVAIGLPPEQVQYIAAANFTLQDIARIYRIPPHLLQELTRATNNNIEHQGIDFVVHTLRPHITRYEQRMEISLFSLKDTAYPRFRVDGLLRGDLASRYAAYGVGRQWGFLNADEIREYEDMNPLPDGEGQEYLRPVNMTPVPGGAAMTFADPADQGDGGDPGDQGDQDARRLALGDVLTDAIGRIARRERGEVLAAARRYADKGDVEGLRSWMTDFIEGQRTYAERTLEPVVKAARRLQLEPAAPPELAGQMAARSLNRLSGWIDASRSAGEVVAQLESAYGSVEAEELELILANPAA